VSLVASRLSLKHAVTIERATSAPDSWGNPGPPTWTSLVTDLPCRVWTNAGREAVDATTVAVIEDMRLIVTLDTDVTEQDRISVVKYRGDTIVTGPVSIRAVLRHQDHLELVLTRVA